MYLSVHICISRHLFKWKATNCLYCSKTSLAWKCFELTLKPSTESGGCHYDVIVRTLVVRPCAFTCLGVGCRSLHTPWRTSLAGCTPAWDLLLKLCDDLPDRVTASSASSSLPSCLWVPKLPPLCHPVCGYQSPSCFKALLSPFELPGRLWTPFVLQTAARSPGECCLAKVLDYELAKFVLPFPPSSSGLGVSFPASPSNPAATQSKGCLLF